MSPKTRRSVNIRIEHVFVSSHTNVSRGNFTFHININSFTLVMLNNVMWWIFRILVKLFETSYIALHLIYYLFSKLFENDVFHFIIISNYLHALNTFVQLKISVLTSWNHNKLRLNYYLLYSVIMTSAHCIFILNAITKHIFPIIK